MVESARMAARQLYNRPYFPQLSEGHHESVSMVSVRNSRFRAIQRTFPT